MTATLNVQFTNPAAAGAGNLDGTRADIVAAFQEWTRHFDYTAGIYTLNVTFTRTAAPAGVTISGDTFVRVGTSSGTPVLETLFGLDVAARNGVTPITAPLTLSINNADTLGSIMGVAEREFGHALGIRSSRGTAPAPFPAGAQSVYDGSIIGNERALEQRMPGLPLFFAGPNAVGAFTGTYSTLVPLSNVDGSLTIGAGSQTVDALSTYAPATQVQPLDVALLRDAGLPALTDRELAEHQLARLYFGAFGRIAGGAELVAAYRMVQSAQVSASTLLGSVAAGLVSSAEFSSRYGTLSDADYVRAVYQNTFGRAVDGALLGSITAYLAGPGQGPGGRGAVLAALTETDEARGRLSANANVTYAGTVEAQVGRLYDTAFGRAADYSGFGQYTRAVINGFTLRQAAASFLQSGEFIQRYGAAPSDQALVDGLYQNTLGRAPDAAGEAQYLRALASGTFSRADLIVAFSESGEHTSLVAQRASARDAAGLFANTQPQLGIIPMLSGTAPYPPTVSSGSGSQITFFTF